MREAQETLFPPTPGCLCHSICENSMLGDFSSSLWPSEESVLELLSTSMSDEACAELSLLCCLRGLPFYYLWLSGNVQTPLLRRSSDLPRTHVQLAPFPAWRKRWPPPSLNLRECWENTQILEFPSIAGTIGSNHTGSVKCFMPSETKNSPIKAEKTCWRIIFKFKLTILISE